MTYTRINDTKVRKNQILEAGLELAREHGYQKVSREKIADKIGCSVGTITHRCGTMDAFRRSLMRLAVAREDLKVIAQGLVAGDRFAKAASDELKKRAMAAVAA